MSETKRKHSFIDLFEGIIIGGAAAAAAAFVFGTKKGKELQKKVVAQYKKLGRTTKGLRQKFEKIVHLHTAKKMKRASKSSAKRTRSKRVHRRAA